MPTKSSAPHEPNATGSAGDLQIQLRITGMHCAGCAATVQKAIESNPNVASASVSVTDGRALVTGRILDAQTLIQAVREKGFDAETIDEALAPAALKSEIELRQSTHERQWRYRAIVGLGVWVPMELFHWIAHVNTWPWQIAAWVTFLGASVVLIAAGAGFYRSAFNAAKHRTTNMDTLISMGATTAYVFSLVLFIMRLSGSTFEQPLYFSEAAALLGIISLGHWMEARASAKAGSAVRELLELQPDVAELIDDADTVREVPSASVQPGDRVLIRPGSRMPVDGTVVEGASDVDESVVTGESIPVTKTIGDTIVAGSMNTTGRLVVEATVDGKHTTVSRIAELVQQAQSSKADIQRLADRVAAVFVPTVLGIAAITVIGWLIAGDFPTGIISAVTVLIISCPCALGLATPMAVMVGAGAASHHGILIKSAQSLELAGRVQRVVFDKTGTLTAGKPAIHSIETEDPRFDENAVLQLAASVEAPSEHPIAKSIVALANNRKIELLKVDDFKAIPGQGVRGIVNDQHIEVRRDSRAGCRVLVDDIPVGLIQLTDELYEDAIHAVKRLREMGLTVSMLSGDRREVAESIGNELGIDAQDIIAEANPESKTEYVSSLTESTIMVGDGINDAAALAQADVGIAMASGTNIAIESADVVIPTNHVMAVPETIMISRRTLTTIRQNLFFAFFYNAAAIPAAAFGLLGPAGPLIAAAAMGLSDVTVIGNALRLKRKLRILLKHE